MVRSLVLAAAAVTLCFASACGGAIANDGQGTSVEEGSPQGSGSGSASRDQTSEDGAGSYGDGKRGSTEDGANGTGDRDEPNEPGEPPTTPGFPQGPNACFTVSAGVCANLSTAKAKAAELCAGKGYELAALTIGAQGKCSVTCCDGSMAPSPPPPPPPAETCNWTVVGDEKNCSSRAELKKLAFAVCASQKGYVRSLYPAGNCANGATVAKVECCFP